MSFMFIQSDKENVTNVNKNKEYVYLNNDYFNIFYIFKIEIIMKQTKKNKKQNKSKSKKKKKIKK